MTIYRDPRCVYVTDELSAADVVCSFLNSQGIPAQVMNQATLGGLLGLTYFARTGVSSLGMEVWAMDPAQVEAARKLLEAHSNLVESKQMQLEELGPVDATCEECGHTSSFPGKQRGTIQECPKCREYIDVPNPGFESDW
jgi:hypothetical protein